MGHLMKMVVFIADTVVNLDYGMLLQFRRSYVNLVNSSLSNVFVLMRVTVAVFMSVPLFTYTYTYMATQREHLFYCSPHSTL